MKNEKLNSLAFYFSSKGDESSLEKVYKQSKKELRMRQHYDSRWIDLPRSDIEEIHLNAFFDAARNYNKEVNFRTFLDRCVNNLLRNEKKKKNRRAEELQDTVVFDFDDDEVSMIDSLESLDKTDCEAIKKEQRQLLRHLHANADDFSKSVLETFLVVGTVGATAKSLGSNDERVRRALARVGRQFDTNQLGEYTDYLNAT